MVSKYALVIANTEYQDESFAKLSAPGKDAEEFAFVLRELAAFDDVLVLLNEGEGKTRRSIARFFAERKRDDLLLLYFSGHGVRNEQGQLFLAANDTEISILEASGIPSDFVTNAMNNSRSQRQLLILDCCNSGAFAHGTKSASAVGKSMGIASAFEGSGFGRVVLTATDATQFAWEGDKVIGDTQKSVFTHFLIEGLKGDADRNSDGRIDVDELYDYAYEEVVRRTPKQTPGKWSYRQQGDIVLRENLKPREVKAAQLPAELLEMLSHPNSGVRRAGIQELISLLDTKHLGLVRAAQEKLNEIAVSDDSLSLRKSASDTLIARGLFVERPVETPKEEYIPPLLVVEKSVREERVKVQPLRSPVDWRSITSKSNFRLVGGIAGGLLIIGFLIWGGSKLLQNLSHVTTEPTGTFQPTTTISAGSQPNATPATETSVPVTSALDIGSTKISDKDGMTLLYVPAGNFTMGIKAEDALAECQKIDCGLGLDQFEDEGPPHEVYLDAFWIDKTEVTNKMYELCVQAGACKTRALATNNSESRPSYYGNSDFDNYPVIYIDWNNAKTYCEWAGRRLPTEAEWEKAASWDAKNQTKYIYPWGNSAPNSDLLNSGEYQIDTTAVGTFPNGASPYGALDMAGNVWEWVNDWYDVNYYASSPSSNPQGPASGQYKVLRGGAYDFSESSATSTSRSGISEPATTYYTIGSRFGSPGFRCAVSETERTGSTPLPQPAVTQTPELGIDSTMISDKDGMTLLYVPAGKFIMGDTNRLEVYEDSDVIPAHEVFLDAFWIDQTEVTNEMYSKCLQDEICPQPSNTAHFRNPDYANHPVVAVSWDAASKYCTWADRRLPTEAEWEKAARGDDRRIYPWGGSSPNNDLLNYDNHVGSTTEVGSYPDGVSPYGALDMSGNVWEWVSDWYSNSYYSVSPTANPQGPDTGTYHVIRGNGWMGSSRIINWWEITPRYIPILLYTRARGEISNANLGFRCASSVSEDLQSPTVTLSPTSTPWPTLTATTTLVP